MVSIYRKLMTAFMELTDLPPTYLFFNPNKSLLIAGLNNVISRAPCKITKIDGVSWSN